MEINDAAAQIKSQLAIWPESREMCLLKGPSCQSCGILVKKLKDFRTIANGFRINDFYHSAVSGYARNCAAGL